MHVCDVTQPDAARERAQLLDLTDPAGGGALAAGGRGSGRLFRMDNFIDTTNIEGRFEYSAFVRAYGKYLDEQLAVVAQCGWYQARTRPPSARNFARLRAPQAALSQQGSAARTAGHEAAQARQLQVRRPWAAAGIRPSSGV